MRNLLGGIVAACIVLAFVPISIIAVCILAFAALAAIVYQVATGQPSSLVEYERTVERTDEDGRRKAWGYLIRPLWDLCQVVDPEFTDRDGQDRGVKIAEIMMEVAA